MSNAQQSRARTTLACDACRQGKRRCDGGRPKCALCVKHSRQCVYVDAVATRKRKYWDEDYVRSLEDRILLLESQCRNNLDDPSALRSWESPQKSTFSEDEYFEGGSDDFASPVPVPPDDAEISVPSKGVETDALTTPGNTDAALDELAAVVWKLDINEDGEARFTGPSNSLNIPGMPTSRGRPIATTTPLRATSPNQTYNQLEWEYYSGLFFEKVNPYFQFFPNDNIEMLLASIESKRAQRLVRHAILVSGALQSTGGFAENTIEQNIIAASELALHCSRTCPSEILVTAFSILAVNELTLDNYNMGWMYNCMAGAISSHLALHASNLESLAENTLQQVLTSSVRLRAFWSYFLVDRIATTLLGRYCTTPWRRVNVPLLTSSGVGHRHLDEVVFEHQCRLWNIHDRFMDQIYVFEFSTLPMSHRVKLLGDAQAALLEFRKVMHNSVKLTRTTTKPNIITMHMSYAMSQLLIHRPYLHSEFRSTVVARSAMHTVNAAATTITRLLSTFLRCSDIASAPFFLTHHILSAGTVHLLNSTSNDPALRRRSIARLKICFDALERLSKNISDRASHAISSLRQLAARWNAIYALPIKHSAPLSPECERGQNGGSMSQSQGTGFNGGLEGDGLYTVFEDVLNSGFLDLWQQQQQQQQQSVPDEYAFQQHDGLNLADDGINLGLLWAYDMANTIGSPSKITKSRASELEIDPLQPIR